MLYLHNIVTFLVSVLAGLGVGSGGSYLLWLTEGMGMPHEKAVGVNLFCFVLALLSAFFMHIRKRQVDLFFLLCILWFGIPGACIGHVGRAVIPEGWRHIFLGVFLIFAGVFSIFISNRAKKAKKLDKSPPRDYN